MIINLITCLILILSPGAVKRTIDGDTFTLYNVGVSSEEKVRILHVNAYEISDTLGPAARAYTIEWLSRGDFQIAACSRDSFGRLLAVVTRGVDTLAVDLIRTHLGVPFR